MAKGPIYRLTLLLALGALALEGLVSVAPASIPRLHEVGLVPGVFAGSALMALATREFRLQGFEGGPSMLRYFAGAGLMGFGAMLAGGCAVRAADADANGWTTVSDLADAAESLNAGFTSEFMERPDGYPGLRAAYGGMCGHMLARARSRAAKDEIAAPASRAR